MGKITATLLLLGLCCSPAFAHSAARGFVLLLPTGYVILGGALAVLASFAIASLFKNRLSRPEISERPPSARRSQFPSLVSAVLLGLLIWIGFSGPHDPAENLLPLAIWTLWWVVLVLLHPLFGNLWAVLNPFSGVHVLLNRALVGHLEPPPLRLPVSLAYWPAVLTFAAFAWFQLVDPSPQDPSRLALVVALYAAATMLAVVAFGPKAWLGRCDPFAIFLAQLGAAAPFTQAGGFGASVACAASRCRNSLCAFDSQFNFLRRLCQYFRVVRSDWRQSIGLSWPHGIDRGQFARPRWLVPGLDRALHGGSYLRMVVGGKAWTTPAVARPLRPLAHPHLDCLSLRALPG